MEVVARHSRLKLAFRAVSHTRGTTGDCGDDGHGCSSSKYTRLWPWYAFYGFIMAGVGLWSLRNSKKVNELLK